MLKLVKKVQEYGCQQHSQRSSSFNAPDQSQVRARSTERPAVRPENQDMPSKPPDMVHVDMIAMGFSYTMVCL